MRAFTPVALFLAAWLVPITLRAADREEYVFGTISNIDAARMVLVIQRSSGGVALQIKAGFGTSVTLDKKSCEFDQLRAGQKVGVFYDPRNNIAAPRRTIAAVTHEGGGAAAAEASRPPIVDKYYFSGEVIRIQPLRGSTLLLVRGDSKLWNLRVMRGTRVTFNGQPASAASLRPGASIDVIIRTHSNGAASWIATSSRWFPTNGTREPVALPGAVLAELEPEAIGRFRFGYDFLRERDGTFRGEHSERSWDELKPEAKVELRAVLEEAFVRYEREMRVASALRKMAKAVFWNWYAKTRKVSVGDALQGRGPSETIGLGELLVDAVAFSIRDDLIASALRDLYPEFSAAEIKVAKTWVALYLDNKATLEDLSKELVKDWLLDEMRQEVRGAELFALHGVEFADFMSSVHERVARDR